MLIIQGHGLLQARVHRRYVTVELHSHSCSL